jgi:peptidyl-prolyl cis-trans isomerase SurA
MNGLRTAVASAMLAVFTAAAAVAQDAEQSGEVIDRVVAVVEDYAVLQSELELEYERYIAQLQQASLSPDEKAEAKKQILDGLISDLLMTIHAERLGIAVSDQEIQEQLEGVIAENTKALGGEEAFRQQLEQEGLTLDGLRKMFGEKIRTRMLVERLLRREVLGGVQVTDADIRAYYREHLAELPKRPPTVTLAQILIVPSPSDKALDAARDKIGDVERRLAAGQDFAALAKEFSDDPSAPNGGSLGYVRLEDLNSPTFEEAARSLIVGEVSTPVLTQFGYHLIKLEDVSEDRVLIRHILARVNADETDIERTARRAEEVRRQLLDGADFGETAARVSDDAATKNSGGVVGEIAVENLPEFFREVIKDVAVGDISQVVKEQKGFRIVKILGRTPQRDYTFEEAREELQRLIEQEKQQENVKEYVDELKEIYYVEVKGAREG